MSAAGYDVAVIGGGIVGTAITRELVRHGVDVALIEAAADVGAGTTKANTAIWHTGFDAKPGTLEAQLVRRGYERLTVDGPELGIPLWRTGALLVAWDDAQLASFDEVRTKAAANGYERCRQLDAAELYAREPHLGPGALGAVEVPDEGLLCPFTMPIAFATQALAGGAALLLDTRVTAASTAAGRHRLQTSNGEITARYVVNAAGVMSDHVNRMFGHDGFTVTPRRGQLLVFDKLAGGLLDHVLLPIPTARTKGMLVAPTVYGNVLVGPTAEDLDDRRATATTAAGHEALHAWAAKVLPALTDEDVTAAYAGLRAATEHSDYQLFADAAGYVCAGGVRSTGLSSCLAIAEHVVGLLDEAGLRVGAARDLPEITVAYLGADRPRPCTVPALVAANPQFGRVVCHCEQVSEAELRDALDGPLPAVDVDGLRRRTRVGQGRCQGFYCGARVEQILADARR